jgi:hypothetical protein
MTVNIRRSLPVVVSGLAVGGLVLALSTLSSAQYVHPHPQHPVHSPSTSHPVHPPRPTRTPPFNGTPTPQPTPTPHFVSCPAQPDHILSGRVTKLFYAYPSAQRSLQASGFFQVDYFSNGIHPATEPASLTLTDDDGAVILGMPDIKFSDTGGGSFSASNDQGFISIRPFAGTYQFNFTFDQPNFPPDFFRVRLHLCMNIGDDGIGSISIVCQHKSRGGFLCHQ